MVYLKQVKFTTFATERMVSPLYNIILIFLSTIYLVNAENYRARLHDEYGKIQGVGNIEHVECSESENNTAVHFNYFFA